MYKFFDDFAYHLPWTVSRSVIFAARSHARAVGEGEDEEHKRGERALLRKLLPIMVVPHRVSTVVPVVSPWCQYQEIVGSIARVGVAVKLK